MEARVAGLEHRVSKHDDVLADIHETVHDVRSDVKLLVERTGQFAATRDKVASNHDRIVALEVGAARKENLSDMVPRRDLDEVKKNVAIELGEIKKEVADLNGYRNRISGIALGLGAGGGALGTVLAKLLMP